jgi:hemerythrin-like metal-binding protein
MQSVFDVEATVMTLLHWKDSYSVGVSDLDQDHKRLIAIINRVAEAEEQGRSIAWSVEELADYARHHFAREERMMRAAGYEAFDDHRAEHKAFLEWLRSVTSALHLDAMAQYHLAPTIKAYLGDWLDNHILKSDMQYKGRIGDVPAAGDGKTAA